ncbi:PilZ domain-containing protein [Aggregicoccus sp. 17bor-14]|uniref:PilZ domain-containing protein n=1 Tax=Myxococcaceae TaxID=31 RepID=UPI00351A2339
MAGCRAWRRSDEEGTPVPARFEVRFEQQETAARALRAYSIGKVLGGLCLRTARTLSVGDPVQLGLRIAGEAWALAAVVAWVRPEAKVVGVRFVDVAAPDQARLQQVVGEEPRRAAR